MNPKYIHILRLAAQYWVPALGTLMFTLGSIWAWSFTENLVGTIMAVDTFLGVLVGFQKRQSNAAAFDGHILVNTEDPTKDLYTIDLGDKLPDLANRKELRIKVSKGSQE